VDCCNDVLVGALVKWVCAVAKCYVVCVCVCGGGVTMFVHDKDSPTVENVSARMRVWAPDCGKLDCWQSNANTDLKCMKAHV
jgi:hypothetical protein